MGLRVFQQKNSTPLYRLAPRKAKNQVLSQHVTNSTSLSSRHALTRHNNSTTIPRLQGQGDREVRLRSPQTGSSSMLPTSGKPRARGELSHAQERDRPRPPSLHATHSLQNTSKDQTRVMRPVQDAIGQMPPICSHRKPERWRGEHTPAVFGPVQRIVGPTIPGIDFLVNHDTYPNDCKNTACTKIGDWYQPGSWIIVTQDYNEGEGEFVEVKCYACTECAERSKRSFLGYRLLGKHEAEPVLTAKGKEKELPPLPVQVPLKTTGPVAMMSCDMAMTTRSPRVRLPRMPKKESPMQRAINGSSASMAEIVQ